MQAKYVEGDLFAVLKGVDPKTVVYIPHVCNCKGAFGAGFVVPLGRTFPSVMDAYLKWSKAKPKDAATKYGYTFDLGNTQFVQAQDEPKIVVANMVAQTLGGPRPLFYNHLVACMELVAERIIGALEVGTHESVEIMAPFFGTGLAQGNPNFIALLIEDTWIKRSIPTTIFYLKGTIPEGWTPPA